VKNVSRQKLIKKKITRFLLDIYFYQLIVTDFNCKSLVPEDGLEPSCLAAVDFESTASTDFTTRACAL
jgi:hypothetical protein